MQMNMEPNDVPAGEPSRPEPPGAASPPPGAGYGPPPGWRPGPARPDESPRWSPALACVLSLMPGLGQVYLGYYRRGFVHILVVASVIALLAEEPVRELTPLLGMFLAFFWLYNVVDAGRRAAFLNQIAAGGTAMAPPIDLPAPAGSGSLVGGGVLILVGSLLLARTRFGLPMLWLREWWPIIPIFIGAYLLVRGLKERGKEA